METFDHDIQILKEYSKLGTINVYVNNTTDIKRDEELVEWFVSKYQYLNDYPTVEVLYDNVNFGVGD